jgi:hypothetical protein
VRDDVVWNDGWTGKPGMFHSEKELSVSRVHARRMGRKRLMIAGNRYSWILQALVSD